MGGCKNVQVGEWVGRRAAQSAGEWAGRSLGKVGMAKAGRQALRSACLLVL